MVLRTFGPYAAVAARKFERGKTAALENHSVRGRSFPDEVSAAACATVAACGSVQSLRTDRNECLHLLQGGAGTPGRHGQIAHRHRLRKHRSVRGQRPNRDCYRGRWYGRTLRARSGSYLWLLGRYGKDQEDGSAKHIPTKF